MPSVIQKKSIPLILRDFVGIAQTGSGKTGAFALPILQGVLTDSNPFYALVLVPTRELAIQIVERFGHLGIGTNMKCAPLVGGTNNVYQRLSLAKKPYIIIATP